MIKAKSLTLVYDNQTVGIENLNLNIDKGEVVLLLGPSGAGKSSLLKLIMGAKFPTDGVLMVDEHTISPGSKINITELRQMISPVFQDFKLLEDKSALENVILGLRVLGHTPGKMQEKSKSALEKVGLGDKLNDPVKFLSYGERQRVAVARAIARDSKIILADEPTGNLDDENSRRIINLLVNLGDKDKVVIIATHERNLVSELNLRTLYLGNGKLTKESVVTTS